MKTYPILALWRAEDGKLTGTEIAGCDTLDDCQDLIRSERYGDEEDDYPGNTEIECFTMSNGDIILPEDFERTVER